MTLGFGVNRSSTSSIRAICGVYLGLTNDPTTILGSPVSPRAFRRRTLSSTEMPADSICIPSRIVSSRYSIVGQWESMGCPVGAAVVCWG